MMIHGDADVNDDGEDDDDDDNQLTVMVINMIMHSDYDDR